MADAKRAPPVKFNADANVFVTELAPGASPPPFELGVGRQAYMLAMEGDACVEGAHGDAALAEADGAELRGPSTLRVTAGARGAHLLLVEMAATQ